MSLTSRSCLTFVSFFDQRATELAGQTSGALRAEALCIRARCNLGGRRFAKARKDAASALQADSNCAEVGQLQAAIDEGQARHTEQEVSHPHLILIILTSFSPNPHPILT